MYCIILYTVIPISYELDRQKGYRRGRAPTLASPPAGAHNQRLYLV